MNFKPCGDCAVCCEGHLIGSAYGNSYGNGKKCLFLVEKKCSIYTARPEACKKYQCAWSQSLLPDHLRPDISGILVTVQTDKSDGKQYLKTTEINQTPNNEVYQYLDQFCQENNTYYIKC